jgi:hypothetical protein
MVVFDTLFGSEAKYSGCESYVSEDKVKVPKGNLYCYIMSCSETSVLCLLNKVEVTSIVILCPLGSETCSLTACWILILRN